MPTDAPPAYNTAVQQPAPGVQITTPRGEHHLDPMAQTHAATRPAGGRERASSNASTLSSVSDDSDNGLGVRDLVGEEGRRSMDDEARELPDGWVRCFDVK
jgi:hypothetical protein